MVVAVVLVIVSKSNNKPPMYGYDTELSSPAKKSGNPDGDDYTRLNESNTDFVSEKEKEALS